MAERTCAHCGSSITGRRSDAKYCAKACKLAARLERQRRSAWEPGLRRDCRWCGVSFRVTWERNRALVCSRACGKAWDRWSSGCVLASPLPARVEPRPIAEHRCEWCNAGPQPSRRKYCNAWCGERARGRRVDASPVWFAECAACGDLFTGRSAQAMYCSRKCSKSAKDDRWPITPKKRQRVYERDGFKCQICKRRVDPTDFELVVGSDGREAMVCGPRYPTIDHKIPQAWNGPHEMWNLRTAHRDCNSNRGHDMSGIGWWGADGDKATAWLIENGFIREAA